MALFLDDSACCFVGFIRRLTHSGFSSHHSAQKGDRWALLACPKEGRTLVCFSILSLWLIGMNWVRCPSLNQSQWLMDRGTYWCKRISVHPRAEVGMNSTARNNRAEDYPLENVSECSWWERRKWSGEITQSVHYSLVWRGYEALPGTQTDLWEQNINSGFCLKSCTVNTRFL